MHKRPSNCKSSPKSRAASKLKAGNAANQLFKDFNTPVKHNSLSHSKQDNGNNLDDVVDNIERLTEGNEKHRVGSPGDCLSKITVPSANRII